jgi:hypothetical protein
MSIWDDIGTRLDGWRTQYHDEECEQRERSYICHCEKRERERVGLTELPTENLEFPPPDCPVCDRTLEFDGDGFNCQRCHISWNSRGDGSSARFDDDFGTDFGGEQFGPRLSDLAREDA